jgi:hypothetical protein
VRHLLDFAARRGSRRVAPVVETESFELIRHYVIHEQVIGFQIPIGLSGLDDPRLVLRRISERDLPPGSLILGQMRGRTLPVASARFAMQLAAALEAEGAVQFSRADEPEAEDSQRLVGHDRKTARKGIA